MYNNKNVINFYFLNNILYIKMSKLQIIYYIKLGFNFKKIY